MTDELPVAVWSGSFRLGGVEIRCHVLEDGRRIIDADDLEGFFTAGGYPTDKELKAFTSWAVLAERRKG